MTNFIPIFPLGIVVYPGENVNLHIFEPRYKQLVKDCHENKKPFGIPAVLNNKLQENGTLVNVTELSKMYDNGEMDNKKQGDIELMRKVMNGIRELHKLLNVSKDFKKPDEELKTYEVAHHIGLTLEEEYELLGLMNELQRQEYIKRHVTKVLPMVAEMEGLKEKIKLNGHFQNLSGFQFEL